ncbi:DUF7010 family protein [Chitinophaga ginsengisoli]|uniref:Uncharacterized protein n=1 Tax=Chitinophaga ginsengisoli TaxID=363837 RepID=A0A2P8FUK5_9BACT|nr:hypothetical protein [Chitinophaga ginsengisoli]PSL25403.1 hypothetical protein CLV42_11385 [Chitinophaga ginsengisoli]
MNNASTVKPADKLSGLATGMLMMATFTGIWTVIAYMGLKDSPYKFALILFLILSLILLRYAFKFIKALKHSRDQGVEVVSDADKKRDKRFTLVFVGEGLGILIGINLVNNLGHPDLVIPVIALVIGLHFFPLGWLFKRNQDYYVAAWSTAVAVCGILFSIYNVLSYSWVITFIGVGMAVATAVCGGSMLIRGLKMRIIDK